MNFGTFWDTQNFNLGHRSFATENSTSYILVEALAQGFLQVSDLKSPTNSVENHSKTQKRTEAIE